MVATVQMNLRVPQNLLRVATTYAEAHGYRNLQELFYESVREKVFEHEFDEEFSEKEISVIDQVLETSLRENKLADEKTLRAALRA